MEFIIVGFGVFVVFTLIGLVFVYTITDTLFDFKDFEYLESDLNHDVSLSRFKQSSDKGNDIQ